MCCIRNRRFKGGPGWAGACRGHINLFLRQPGTPLWVVLQEMPQRHKQLRSMPYSALVQSLVNVVDDHSSYDLAAVRLLRQATCQGRGSNFRDMFMLGNRGNLVLVAAVATQRQCPPSFGAPRTQ
jgi:hypothetical protein